jgi:mono/diheme cytochrome c family protein
VSQRSTTLAKILIGLVLQSAPAVALAAGDPANGLQLARHWCVGCHLVAPGDIASASDSAPPFPEIAKDPATTPERLRSWLSQPHPAMPDLMLTRDQNDDLVAYIASLKDQ